MMVVLNTSTIIMIAASTFVALGVHFIKSAMNECKDFIAQLDNLIDAEGKIFVVTGANSGLGFHTSLLLARAKGKVVLACRDSRKCKEAKNKILEDVPYAALDDMNLDLSSFESIKLFAASFKKKYGSLDVLVNNAGIMALPERSLTAEGHEAQFGTNHLGHFFLTGLLYPYFKKNGRVINHSSSAHQFSAANFTFTDMQSVNYVPWVAYGNSKMANLLFTYELNKRLQAIGNSNEIISIAVHPGYTATNLQTGKFPFWEFANNAVAMTGEDGSLSQVLAAAGKNVAPSMNNFIGPKYVIFGAPSVQSTSPASWDAVAQKYLWEKSVELTGVDFASN